MQTFTPLGVVIQCHSLIGLADLPRHGQSWAVGKTLVFFKLPAYVLCLKFVRSERGRATRETNVLLLSQAARNHIETSVGELRFVLQRAISRFVLCHVERDTQHLMSQSRLSQPNISQERIKFARRVPRCAFDLLGSRWELEAAAASRSCPHESCHMSISAGFAVSFRI